MATRSDNAAIAERLSIALGCARPKLKQNKLAKQLGVSGAAVSHWFSGTRACPPDRLKKIAALTGVDATWLVMGTGVDPRGAGSEGASEVVSEEGAKLKWVFRPAPEDGKDFGNAGIYATPNSVRTIVREDGQNSLDATLGGMVTIRFRVIELDPTTERHKRFLRAAGFPALSTHVAACESSSKIGARLDAGLDRVRQEKLVLLAIDDYGTTGLTGTEFDSTQPYCALVRDNLNSRKSTTTSGGVFGVGAKANLACSSIGTVFIASKVQGLEKKGTRLVGRAELTYHEVPGRGGKTRPYAGPGWFGVMGDRGVAESAWVRDDDQLLDDLLLRRDRPPEGARGRAVTGTTVLIVGFTDPALDLSVGTKQLAEQVIEAVAVSFWPALVKKQLSVLVERYVGDQDEPATSERVDPKSVAGVQPFCAALEKYAAGDEAASLTEEGDVVAVPVPLEIPATRPRANVNQHPELSSECKLLIRLAPPADGKVDPRLNNVAYVRGRAMVTRYQNKSNALVGGRPFHAVLLAGTLVGKTSEQVAAEEFLRLSEPPAHDKWTQNSDLAELYVRGSKRMLDEFFDRVAEQLQRMLRPLAISNEEGPAVLDHLFMLRKPKGESRPRPRATIRRATGRIQDGAWVVDAEISIDPSNEPLLLTPLLSFEQEGGGRYKVGWSRVEVVEGPAELRGTAVLAPARAKRISFTGVSDPTTHPVDAASSAVMVDVTATTAR